MNTIVLPDGYNGRTVECFIDPVYEDFHCYKLKVAGSDHLLRWITKADYISECFKQLNKQ